MHYSKRVGWSRCCGCLSYANVGWVRWGTFVRDVEVLLCPFPLGNCKSSPVKWKIQKYKKKFQMFFRTGAYLTGIIWGKVLEEISRTSHSFYGCNFTLINWFWNQTFVFSRSYTKIQSDGVHTLLPVITVLPVNTIVPEYGTSQELESHDLPCILKHLQNFLQVVSILTKLQSTTSAPDWHLMEASILQKKEIRDRRS